MTRMPAPSPFPRVSPRIDDPIELLVACHDKVRHFTGLAERLASHVTQHGADKQAAEAARAVLRYFEMAAPHHHADEDENLFPALAALGDAELNATLHSLTAQHDELADQWALVATWLRQVMAQAKTPPASVPAGAIQAFAAAYRAHAHREEEAVYPHASRLPREAMARIAAAMVARRTTPQPA